MKTKSVTMLFYGPLVLAAAGGAWVLAPWVLSLASASSIGACMTAVFAALYIGELKQESIGQLYQALASANLRSAEVAVFSHDALARIRTIRRLFLFSNVVKLLGSLAGLLLVNEKAPTATFVTGTGRFGFGMLFLSLILFVRLYAEVSSTEVLLLAIKQSAAVKAKRDAFLAAGKSAKAHDFSTDPAAKSFDNPPTEPLLMPVGQ